MNTNNREFEQGQLLDTKILEAMAGEFFPEFSNAENISGQAPFSEEDYIRAIGDIYDGFEENNRASGYSPVLVPETGFSSASFDVYKIRKDFPIMTEKVEGRDLIWLDNAATTQKPRCVIDRLSYFYSHENSNVHRGAHTLAARSTDAYEGARKKAGGFLNASTPDEIVFVRGTTEAINLVAYACGKFHFEKDDEVLISELEHHANIVPWQIICEETGAKLRVIPVDGSGQIMLDKYERLLGSKTKIVAFTHVSNALGTITPAAEMTAMAHRYGAKVLIDGAQAVSHLPVDVQELDCDFYAFSGHKIFGPTGIGVLYAKQEILQKMKPYQGGGNMISDVTFEKTVYQDPPHRFEAGTGSIADAVGLGAALDYVSNIGLETIRRYEHELLEYSMEQMKQVPGLTLIGTAAEKTSVLSFVLKGHSTESVGKALSSEGIAVRAGHHCAQPILRKFGLESTVRPSLAFYNTCSEIDKMVSVLADLAKGAIAF
ncbi:MAG: family 2A encapsulin nanocompartment cargo protein cysteine desulfurase [Brevinematales bacterium]